MERKHVPQPVHGLPIAYLTLRILIVLNWIYAACLIALLSYSFVNEPFLTV